MSKSKKISVSGIYPYTSTRVRAMKSMLLGKDDYLRLRKMGLNEIIRFLKEGKYKNEIEALSKEYSGIELINLALNENMAAEMNKLVFISSDRLKYAVRLYAMKWVIGNIKITVRAKLNRFSEKDIKYSIIPVKPADREFCFSLLKKDADEAIAEIRKMLPVDAELLKSHYSGSNLISIENMLDRAYYGSIESLSVRKELQRFFASLIELMNIKNILKMKMSGAESNAIKSLIVGRETPLLKRLINADKEKIADILKRRYPLEYSDAVKFENSMEKYLLQYSFRLMHSSPISEAPVFGYLLAKEIEVRNLRLLVNAKAMEMDEKFIEENLIVAS